VPPANLTLRYSNLEPDPNDIYSADDPNGPWTSIGHTPQAAPYTIDTHTNKLGYFAAGYTAGGATPVGVVVGGGQVLPIIVAALIIVVVLAGLPLAVMRRRRAGGGGEGAGDDEDEP
jgi:hypothetical protein